MKIFKRILLVLGIVLLIGAAYFSYKIFVEFGLKPWNKKEYTVQAIDEYAKDNGLKGDFLAYLPSTTPPYFFNHDTAIKDGLNYPMCRVFDSTGRLMYNATCFESIPVFVDSLGSRHSFYFRKADTSMFFDDFGSKILNTANRQPILFKDLEPKEYYIIYCWDNFFGHSMKKYRELVDKLKTSKTDACVISVSMSDVK